jgi:hypothetical protein
VHLPTNMLTFATTQYSTLCVLAVSFNVASSVTKAALACVCRGHCPVQSPLQELRKTQNLPSSVTIAGAEEDPELAQFSHHRRS